MKLESAAEVRELYPKMIDRWIMVGYNQWYKRKFGKRPDLSKEQAVNKAIKRKTPKQIAEIVARVKKAFN